MNLTALRARTWPLGSTMLTSHEGSDSSFSASLSTMLSMCTRNKLARGGGAPAGSATAAGAGTAGSACACSGSINGWPFQKYADV